MTPEQIQQKIFYGYAKAALKLGATFNIYRSSTPITPIASGNLIGTTQMTASQTWDYMKANRYGNAVWNACLNAQSVDSPDSCRVGDYLSPTIGSDAGYYASAVSIVNGGTGYAIGDIVILGGSEGYIFTQYINLVVTSISGEGVITGLAITQAGQYSSPLPPNPFHEYYTSGSGMCATFNIAWSTTGIIDDNSIYFVMALQFDMPPQVVKCNNVLSIIRPSQNTGGGYQGYAAYTPETSETVMTAMPASVLRMGGGDLSPIDLPTDAREPKWLILMPNLGNVIVRIGDIIIDNINENYVVTENELTELGWRIGALQVVNSR
jgi:hypothetical protein